jgi:uncharacterized protein (TIGR02996 family)
MRTFTIGEGRSQRFWNIDLHGDSFTVSWGRGGGAGQSRGKRFASASAARQAHDTLIAEKTADGYVETTGQAAPGRPPASVREALERAIIDDPSDTVAHMAYADWLSEQPSPLDAAQAELMRIQLAQEDDSISAAELRSLYARDKSLRRRHQRDWAGPWVDLAKDAQAPACMAEQFPEPWPVRFVRGLPAQVTFGELTFRCAALFATSPQTRFVRKLAIGRFSSVLDAEPEPGEEDVPRSLEHLANLEAPEAAFAALMTWPGLANMRVLLFGSGAGGGKDVHELIGKAARLEELYLFADEVEVDRVFSLPMPHLRVLRMGQGLAYPLETLAANSSLTNLTHLLLEPGDDGDGGLAISESGLKAVARSPHLKKLTHLRLRPT